MTKLLLTAYCLLFTFPLYGGYFIDSPSPEAIYSGNWEMGIRVGPDGGLLARLSSVPFDGLSIGLSYGGNNILGYNTPKFYKNPGIALRVLIFEETHYIPKIILGFDSQGYDYDGEKFETRAKGIYALAGKQFGGLQGGIGANYNTEERVVGLFAGAVFDFSYNYALVGDYSFYFDGEYLVGLGLRFNLGAAFAQFAFRGPIRGRFGRVLDIGYKGYF